MVDQVWTSNSPEVQKYYQRPIEVYEQIARERIEEWDYVSDPHGYCHDRSVLVGLLAEITRLRGNG